MSLTLDTLAQQAKGLLAYSEVHPGYLCISLLTAVRVWYLCMYVKRLLLLGIEFDCHINAPEASPFSQTQVRRPYPRSFLRTSLHVTTILGEKRRTSKQRRC